MRELTVARKQVPDERGNTQTYDYSILIGEMAVSPGISCESYGVRIREQDGEIGEIYNVTVNIARIDELMELLVRNAVTPCTLRDVIDDWL